MNTESLAPFTAADAPSAPARPRPNLLTIVRPEARHRFAGMITRGLTPQRVQSVLDGAFGGSLWAQLELFDLMEDTWPRLKKNLNEIKRAVVQAQWRAEASCRPEQKPSALAEAKRDLLSDAMNGFRPDLAADENGFEQMLYDLCDAVGKGISVQEILWEARPAATLPRAARWIPGRCYGYPPEGATLQLCPDGLSQWQPFPPDKFIVAMFKTKTGSLASAGMLRSLAAMWIGASFSYDWALNLAQLFGLPFRWVEYDPAQKGLLKPICDMLENMGSAGWGAFPAGTKLELHEAVRSAGDSPQAYLMQIADTACDILILGQTLTTESGSGGSLALGKVHERVREDVLRYVGHWAATALNYSLVPALMRLNFGDNAEDPYLVCELIEIDDAVAMAQRDAVLFGQLGMSAPRKWLYERHGVPLPGPDDEHFSASDCRAGVPPAVTCPLGGASKPSAALEAQVGMGSTAPSGGTSRQPGRSPCNQKASAGPVQAALAETADAALIRSPFAVALPANAKTLPADIQWMPPGVHAIRATQAGQPVERIVRVDAATAERMQAVLELLLAAAERGEGDRPYFDFNHEDGAASAWPLEFSWAGADPHTGGVRARVEWSAEGRGAILGRTYRRFSPCFFVAAGGEVTAAPVNMGGLVNRAAFRAIQPIWSKDAAAFPATTIQPDPTTAPTIMKSLMATLASLGFVAGAEVDETTAILQINAKAGELLDAGAELTAVRAQLQTAQADLTRTRRAHAESVVNQAALDGRIPPREPAVRARWTRLIEEDPANAALLPGPNPALQTVVTARREARAEATDDHPFLAKSRELARDRRLSDADAVVACGWQHPGLYEDYRRALFAGAGENAEAFD